MARVNTTITIDSDVKREAAILLREFGLDLSSAVNFFLRQMIREQKIPFEIGMGKNYELTTRAIEDAKNGRNMIGPFNSANEMWGAIDAEELKAYDRRSQKSTEMGR